MSFFHLFKKAGESLQSLFLLALRLIWGSWFLQAGWGKWNNFAGTVDFLRDLGIPFPEINAYALTLTELIGGLLLILGLFSRVAAVPLIIAMLVALLTAHHEAVGNLLTDPQAILKETPLTFLLAALTVFVFGPGKISLDHFMCNRCSKSECNDDHCDIKK